jgi:hypothetical protein
MAFGANCWGIVAMKLATVYVDPSMQVCWDNILQLKPLPYM